MGIEQSGQKGRDDGVWLGWVRDELMMAERRAVTACLGLYDASE